MRVLIVFGTRPEAIKMAPVVQRLRETPGLDLQVCVTAQHREMLDQVLSLFDIVPDIDLDIMKPGQDLTDITANIILALRDVLKEGTYDRLLVHGDTTTTMAGALAAFYAQVPVGHVEAGLRKGHIPSEQAGQYADVIARHANITALLTQVDAVHTLTSLTGFEALIRGLAVTTYGLPFYAGWGLTTDRLRAPDRRKTSIDLATLVHRALIDYPRFFDPLKKTAAPIEVILDRLAQDQIPSAGPFNRGLSKLQGLFASAHPFWR